MDENQKLKNIYKLYNEEKYEEAFSLVQEILSFNPKNIYAKRYEDLLRPYLNDKSVIWKIPTVKWKNLSCPHCLSSIWFPALNQEQRTKIRNNNYNNLSIKCPYCNNIFTLQKKSEQSILWIKIWDKINYLWENYRVTWSVKYAWNWYELGESWELNYLEWILVSDTKKYLYFSEWYFMDEYTKKYEFEFSQKTTPYFSFEFKNESFIINWKKRNFSEKNIIKAASLYWENSKVFEVWEKVEIYEFSYENVDYVLEKEKSWRQSEAWIYKTWSVSKFKAANLFWKEAVFWKENVFSKEDILPWKKNKLLFWLAYLWILFYSISYNYFYDFSRVFGIVILFFIIVLVFTSPVLLTFITNVKKFLFTVILSWPLIVLLLYFSLPFVLETKKEITLENIWLWDKYKIEFENDLQKTDYLSEKTYDYWWVRKYYQTLKWLNFSVKTQEDKEIIEKILKWENLPEELKKIFSQKIYKLK